MGKFWLSVLSLFFVQFSNAKGQFITAYAQDMDGTVKSNEYCRASLAESIYSKANTKKVRRLGKSNVYLFKGDIESYKIVAFDDYETCQQALNTEKRR